MPTATSVKVGLAWYAPRSTSYSYCAPSGAVTTIVPVGTAHVGCNVTLAVGVAGTAGTALTVILGLASDTHVGDACCLAVTVWLPTASSVKVWLAFYALISTSY